MRTPTERIGHKRHSIYKPGFLRMARDESGATAIEFAAVVAPFMMLIFGLIGVAFFFFVNNSIEKGMDQTARLVRTGQAQQSGMTVKQFKESICAKAGHWINCTNLQIFPEREADWNNVQPSPCIENGIIRTSTANEADKIADYVGASSDIVVVTACYHWEFTKIVPYFHIGNMSDGTHMLQAATAFRSEPFAQ
jgi:Flp pilus assembly protein TadG